MLSRSNSSAGERLRRAKSTSSARTSSSGHHRSSTSIDPFVSRHQAEAAALEAYQRASRHDQLKSHGERLGPPRLQKKRSQVTGRTEGSHFEDARLGRRRSTSKKDGTGPSQVLHDTSVQQHSATNTTSEAVDEGRIVTRRRSVIPPNLNDRFDAPSLPSYPRHPRKSQSACSDGSPAPRNAVPKERRSTLQLRTPRESRSEPHGNYPAYQNQVFSAFSSVEEHSHSSCARKQHNYDTRTHEERLAAARDQCLRDFQQKKLRERKSSMFVPFQKRRITIAHKSDDHGFDTGLPPSNCADEKSPPPPPSPDVPVALVVDRSQKRSRNFSDTLKGRFKKVFGKSSKTSVELPPQHIEGTHFQFTTSPPLRSPDLEADRSDDPFLMTSAQTQEPIFGSRAGSASTSCSAGDHSTSKSRVTSWTNSTVAGTSSTRHDSKEQDTHDEYGGLRRNDSLSTLRKASSFFGRPIKNKLRRPSKAGLQSSEESERLYSALQDRLRASDSDTHKAVEHGAKDSSTTRCALESLPSRQKAPSLLSTNSRWAAPTIRSVTPELHNRGIMSPVPEVLSPATGQTPSMPCFDNAHGASDTTPRGHSYGPAGPKATVPSQDQIERRIARSKNRWQSPLDEMSPLPRSARVSMTDDNPYELRSLSQTLQQPIAGNGLPYHAKSKDKLSAQRSNLISPSVYSRATDGLSPRPETPAEEINTVVRITGREVRTYSISPPKREQRPLQASHEWRQWLSEEMNGFDGPAASDESTRPKLSIVASAIGEQVKQSKEPVRDGASARAGSASPAPGPASIQAKARKRSSFMNERYPMVEDNRSSSAQSQHADRRDSAGLRSKLSYSSDTPLNFENEEPTAMSTRHRVISKPLSVANITAKTRAETHRGMQASEQSRATHADSDAATAIEPSSSHGAATRVEKSNYRPRSAFDLRANYKLNRSEKAHPLHIRRKANHSDNTGILEDTTILNISAGPYASHPPSTGIVAPTNDANKENTSPGSHTLPTCSSSEWLAASTTRKRNITNLSAIHPAHRNRSVSKFSPLSSPKQDAGAGVGRSSPGQRLASNWLEGRKSKESSPAFV